MTWLIFALMTVFAWGVYGPLLNQGAIGFGHDRFKAFLFVGVAYFFIAIVGPLIVIAVQGTGFNFMEKPAGIQWSLIAGAAGAIGAFTLLFALSNHPLMMQKKPALAAAQVMAVVFAGAPVVSAVYGIVKNPPKDGLSAGFILGIVMAAAGGALVTLFKPS